MRGDRRMVFQLPRIAEPSGTASSRSWGRVTSSPFQLPRIAKPSGTQDAVKFVLQGVEGFNFPG